MRCWPDSLFAWHGRLARLPYAVAGVSLMAAKYAIDAAVVQGVSGQAWLPWHYLSPLWSTHERLGRPLAAAMVVWAIPFIWMGLAMSVRRCRDAAVKPVWALALFAPVVNYMFMVAMAMAPAAARGVGGAEPAPTREEAGGEAFLRLLRAASVGTLVALPAVVVLAQLTARYSASLFVGAPFAVGIAAGWQLAQEGPVSRRRLAQLSALTGLVAGGTLLLFALEGLVCLTMMVPLTLPLVFLGARLGVELRLPRAAGGRQLAPALLVPFAGALSPAPVGDPVPRPVATHVDIAAPREVVWRHVLAFGDLPPATAWLFRLGGVAYPRRATLDGAGVGAVRRCEFSTGTFVEPITDWRPGERLAFDVVASPPSMREWSPYADLRPPHVDGAFLSRAGSFDLEAVGAADTRLTGTTWYAVALDPSPYWRLWSDAIVHRIHLAVLEHVKALSEAEVRAGGG